MNGNTLADKAPKKATRQYGNTAFKDMPSPNKPAAPLPATDNHHTTTNTLMTNTKLFCCVPALLLLLSLTAIGCRKNPVSPVTEPKISITVEDVSCTEVWVRVKTEGLEKLHNPQFLVNDKPLPGFVLLNGDTLVYVESLKVKQQYTFLVTGSYRTEYDKEKPVSSAKQTATTLDTTSHDFVWQVYQFGSVDYGNSIFNDVVIIDDSHVWLAGEVYINDTLGNTDSEAYGTAFFHGDYFEFKKAKVLGGYPQTYISNAIFQSVVADNNNGVFFIAQTGVFQNKNGVWDRKAFFMTYEPFNSRVYKAWMDKHGSIYCAGDSGALFKVNGYAWTKLSTGTNMFLSAISGIEDHSGNAALFAAGFSFEGKRPEIFKIKDDRVVERRTILDEELVSAVWAPNTHTYFYAGLKLYQYVNGNVKKWQMSMPGRINAMTGKSPADIFVSNAKGGMFHFNGSTWHTYNNIADPEIRYFSIAYKGNSVIAVGYKREMAIVAIGKKAQ